MRQVSWRRQTRMRTAVSAQADVESVELRACPVTFLLRVPSGGRVSFTMIEDAYVTGETQQISFYADQEDSWFAAYGNNDLSCSQKVALAKRTYPLAWLKQTNYTFLYDVAGIVPRWWYITLSNCHGGEGGTEAGLKVSYWRVHFTNRTGLFSFEFSKDVQGILEMSIFFLVLYWCMMFLLAWIKNHAKQKNLQYTVVKYIFISMLIEWIALLFNMAHYAKFAYDGIGVPGLETTYFCQLNAYAFVGSIDPVGTRLLTGFCVLLFVRCAVFDFVSNLVLLYAVLNISKGWAISTNYIPDRRVTYVVIVILFLLYVALFIWVQEIMDPASVLYIYETPPGWTVVAIRSALAVYAIFCVIRTYNLEKETSKRQFYLVWLLLAVFWLISLPLIVGIAHYLESWKRRRVVFGLVNCVQGAMYIVLTYLFRPFRSNRYVDILKPDESRAFGTNQMQIFPSGPIEFSTF
jgi:hypothetical protein